MKTAPPNKPGVKPADPGVLLQRALALHQAGDLSEAQRLYSSILDLEADHIDALYLDGLIAHQRGHYQHALLRLQAARQKSPATVAIHVALGNTYREQGDFALAESSYRSALQLDGADTEAHYNLGIACHERGDLAGAMAAYRQAVAANAQHAESWNNLGVALKATGDAVQALACYEKVVALQPHHLLALFNLGVLHADAERFDQAIDSYRAALLVQPTYIDAAFNLAVAYKSLGAVEDAAKWFEQTLKFLSQHAGALQNLASVRYEQGQFDDADELYRQGLIHTADPAALHYNLSLVALARGDYASGWPAYEWRWQGAEASKRHRRNFIQPQWRGEDIIGQTILLHAEQGLGDTLQFVRYVALVAQRGARVIVECQPELARLVRSMPGIALVVPAGMALPHFDWQCPLMSLPLAFATVLEDVPAVTPYLNAGADDVALWARRIGAEPRRKVGVAWAGNAQRRNSALHRVDQRRSLRPEQLAPLSRCESIAFFSLQLGQAALDEGHSRPSLKLRDLTTDIVDFSDTAALIANLDLVISVDTSVAHLAGALGKPVWLLSRHDACWRWMRDRDDSPWYPTMRIFRQARPGDWADVMARIEHELQTLRI